MLSPQTHTSSFTLLPQFSPLDSAEKIEPIYVPVQRNQTAPEISWSVCFKYISFIFHFKRLKNTSTHIYIDCKDPENHLWVSISQMFKYKWILFDSNITFRWDGDPEIHNSGFR